jgi:Glycosyltransferases involved in cell wall biogenesis
MISVILPTYNEAESVPQVIAGLQHELSENHEIVVVDDNSPDGTAERIRTWWPADDRITVYVRHNESGLGSAVVDGFKHATGTTYLVMDADGQHRPSDAPELVSAVENGADIAVGSRHMDASENNASWGPLRYAISLGGLSIAWAALPESRQLADPMSGFLPWMQALLTPCLTGSNRMATRLC